VLDLKINQRGEILEFLPIGDWTLNNFAQLYSLTKKIETSADKIVIDAKELTNLDSAGSKIIFDCISTILRSKQNFENKIYLENFAAEKQKLFELVFERLTKFYLSGSQVEKTKHNILAKIGILAESSLSYLNRLFSFLGIVSEAFFTLICKPKLFRPKEIVTQIEEACIKSLPVVSLVTFLIGVVVTYLMAMQAEKYGGHIFVVNGVALSMCRELSPVIVALVMAGRSGSAYTAQIGAMKLNEEVDAITTLGLSVQQVLVIPRLIALVLSMPLLVFVGDIVGIFGGLITAQAYLGLSYTTFIERLQTALPVKHVIVGLIKAPFFAAVIAIIGCRRGLATEMNARAVGLSTTATVVESIVLVILLNAAFAVIFANAGI
jgi:phospholipid/cholesterol/gamma-HCH transport system permease protein